LNVQSAKGPEKVWLTNWKNWNAGLNESTADLLRIADESTASQTNKKPNDQPDPLSRYDDSTVAEANERLDQCSNLIGLAYEDATSLGVVGEELTICTLYMAGVSRLLAKPLSVIVQGSSSSGKSFTVEVVSELFPDDQKIIATQFTPQSLFYMPEGSLRHKLVVAGERSRVEDDSTAEATRALREMISAGHLKKLLPTKGPDGSMTTVCVESEGPIAFIESTTLNQIFEEDRNRCVLIHTDESEEQTRRILRSAANSRSDSTSDTIQTQHCIQHLLKSYPVKIPYAERLAGCLPADKVECRRAFGHLLACIKASALLHQRQRPMQDGNLVANEDDYQVAYTLLNTPLTESIGGGVSKVARQYWLWLQSRFSVNDTFCARDLLNLPENPKGKAQTYAMLNELESVHCLSVAPATDRKSPKQYRLNRSPDEAGSPLPEPQCLFESDSVGLSD
jgi:hypothetical protein